MTWRPIRYLLEGELDNTQPGHVTGWLRFAGLPELVQVDLQGDFLADIRGARVVLVGRYRGTTEEARRYMDGFAPQQIGRIEHMTAGQAPVEWTDYPYFEWVSEANERVVLDPEPQQVHVVTPAPFADAQR